MSLDWNYKVKGDTVILNHFFSLNPIKYDIKDIQSITVYESMITPNGNIEKNTHYKVIFKDGYIWNTIDTHSAFSDNNLERIIKDVQHKAHIELIKENVDN